MAQPSDDTPSVTPVGRASSLREGAGIGLAPFIGVLAKIQRCGRFSSPLRNSGDFGFYHSTNDTPSVTPVGRDSSLREGAGNGFHHSSGYSLKSGVTGDFHRPYESDILPFHVGERFVLQSGGGYGIIWGREKILSNQIRSYANGNSE